MSDQLLITIDSNVLVHVFNPDYNTDRHIEVLLTLFRMRDYRACVDKKVIRTEYQAVVEKWLRNQDQNGNEVVLVRHWLDPNNQHRVEVDKTGALYAKVEKIIKRHVRSKNRNDPDWRRDLCRCAFP